MSRAYSGPVIEGCKDQVSVKIHFLHSFLLLPHDVAGRLAGPNGFTNSTALFQPLAEEGKVIVKAHIRPCPLNKGSGAKVAAPEGPPYAQVMVNRSSPDHFQVTRQIFAGTSFILQLQ